MKIVWTGKFTGCFSRFQLLGMKLIFELLLFSYEKNPWKFSGNYIYWAFYAYEHKYLPTFGNQRFSYSNFECIATKLYALACKNDMYKPWAKATLKVIINTKGY